MRKFSSYGPINKKLHYHVPREPLIQKACTQLLGDNPEEGGHYITVWAPRQCGKTWIMIQTLHRLMTDERFHVLKLDLEHLKMTEDVDRIVRNISKEIIRQLNLPDIEITNVENLETLFRKNILDKPLILILDEFDALTRNAINSIAGVFRNIYNLRQKDPNPSCEKFYLLHSVALIGVRSVLGIENERGSPFNVQRSLHISRLTYKETLNMFRQYEKETGQKVEQAVIDRVFYETQGQPGLVSWFGELLTEGMDDYVVDKEMPITITHFERAYKFASYALPNNNILNIISKIKQEPYRIFIIELFKTDEKIPFAYDDDQISFLYMNGVIDREEISDGFYIKFSSPFVQKRLFNYLSRELFHDMGSLSEPFEDLSDTITSESLNIRNLIGKYEIYLKKNREWLLQDAPRRKDMRIFEAVFHFNLYEYLLRFLRKEGAKIWPEFPTGNGKIDLLIQYHEKMYGIELKSYTNERDFKAALVQAAEYAETLKLDIIHLVVFVEYIPDDYRQKYETDYRDDKNDVTVRPVFVETGE